MSESEGSLNINRKIYLRGILLLLIVGLVVYLIINNFEKFGDILLVLLGLGAIVLIHEFGHFIIAKLADIKVEAFSIGLSPVVIGAKRTEKGTKLRILPQFFPKENDPSGEGLLCFRIGKNAVAGDTEYRIGLIPFGGFVGLLGQEDTGVAEKTDDPRAFINKPIISRMAVIAAGVIMNVIAAVALFILVFMIGIKQPPAIVGGVMPNSPAEKIGLLPSDRITEIKGRKDPDFIDLRAVASLSGRDEKIPLTVQLADGTIKKLEIVAKMLPGMPLKSLGIYPPISLSIADVTEQKTLFEKTGLLPRDVVIAAASTEVNTNWQLEKIVEGTFAPLITLSVRRVVSSAEKGGQNKIIQTRIPLELMATNVMDPTSQAELTHICSMVPRLRVAAVSGPPPVLEDKITGWLRKAGIVKEQPASPALQAGDIILRIGDVNLPTYVDMREVTVAYENRQLPVKVLRIDKDGNEKELTVVATPRKDRATGRVIVGISVALDASHPVVARTIKPNPSLEPLAIPAGATITGVNEAKVSNFYDVINVIRHNKTRSISINYRLSSELRGSEQVNIPAGKDLINVKSAFAELVPFEPVTRLRKANGPISAVRMGYEATILKLTETYLTLRRLIEGNVSAKNLIGPVGILAFSYKVVSEVGLPHYLFMLAWLSVALAVFNFLPLPILDGGHMVLLAIEKIKGSPLSNNIQAAWTYTGLTLIGALFLYITGNDVLNLILK